MKYTQVPVDLFETISVNAGILVETFNPESSEIGAIIVATSGGVSFASNPSYKDYGEDIDNVPKGTMELLQIDSYDIRLSGTGVNTTPAGIARNIGAADINGIKVTPRKKLKKTDFKEVWWVGDYSDANEGDSAGFVAIHVMNALSMGGLHIQSEKDGKTKFDFDYKGHFSIEDIDKVPFEVFVKKGTAE